MKIEKLKKDFPNLVWTIRFDKNFQSISLNKETEIVIHPGSDHIILHNKKNFTSQYLSYEKAFKLIKLVNFQ